MTKTPFLHKTYYQCNPERKAVNPCSIWNYVWGGCCVVIAGCIIVSLVYVIKFL